MGTGREAKNRKKPQKSGRRHVGNGGDLVGKKKKYRKERVGPVAANPDNLENNKETGGGGHKLCTSRESVSPSGFRKKYH